ncbi:hypothetical protein [Rhizobium arsenicireducens]
MAEKLGEALLDLNTNDAKFNSSVDKAERKAQRLGLSFDMTAAKALKMGKNLALAAGAATAAVGALVKVAIDQADTMSKAAQRSGVTTEALSRLAWAGELSDVALESLTGSMYRLANGMAAAASGKDKDLAAIFSGLGIAITDTEGRLRSADLVMLDLAQVFASLENGADKTALAVKLFGRSGAELIPLLNNGKQGLADVAAEADRLGITISTDMGRSAEAFNDNLTRVQAAMRGIVVKIAKEALPALERLSEKLADPEFVENAQATAAQVVEALGTIATAIGGIISLIQGAADAWKSFSGAMEWMSSHDVFGNDVAPNPLKTAIDNARKQRDQTISPENFNERFNGTASEKTGRLPAAAPATAPTVNVPNIADLLGGAAGGKKSAGTSEIERQKKAVEDLIERLEEELAITRESDPVQQEMIRLRSTLAGATDEQKAKVEELIAANMKESEALAGLQEAMQTFGDMAVDALDGLIDGSKSLDDVLGDLAKSLMKMVLQAALLGQGPLGNIFGMGATGGGTGGLLGQLFSGFFATGGLIPSGTFGIVGERGPEPVIGTSSGAMVLPNSAMKRMDDRGGGFNFQQTIVPPSGFETRTREEDAAGGKRQEVWFEEAVAGAIGKPGRAQSAVRNTGRLVRR